MEALWDRKLTARANAERVLPTSGGYLAQPEMQRLIQDALDLGMTLVPYETELGEEPSVDALSMEATNRRELEQARNLAAALPEGPLLVWCGNSHHTKLDLDGEWKPMGLCFRELTSIDAFVLDQTVTVDADQEVVTFLIDPFRDQLERLGGTAGFLAEDAPEDWPQWADAYLLSLDNEMT
jgi:hypothetical protein